MSEVLEAPARPAFANFVGGAWAESASGETYEKRGPWRPSEPIGAFPASGEADVDRAVSGGEGCLPRLGRPARGAARGGALARGRRRRPARRADRAGHDAGDGQADPRGPPRGGANGADPPLLRRRGLPSTGERFEQAATGSVVYTTRRPLGVVGLITPWNFPAAIPAWKAAPALAYGNTVVMKLAQEAPLTGLHLAACFEEADIPAGVFNVVIGRGSAVGTPLVAHPDVRAISFTGSVPVGEQVRGEATALGKRVQLELGGHNPAIVMADADLDRAAELVYAGAFWSAGQKCTATRRVYVEDAVYDDFEQRLLARMERGVVGDPTDPETEVGPIVNESQLTEVLEGIERGKADGGSCSRAASGSTPRRTCSRRRSSRASPTTRSSRARRCSGRSRPSTASPSSTRRRAGQRGALRTLGGHLHVEPRVGEEVRGDDRGRHRADQRPDGGRGRPRPVRWHQGLRLRPARAGPRCARVLHRRRHRLRRRLRCRTPSSSRGRWAASARGPATCSPTRGRRSSGSTSATIRPGFSSSWDPTRSSG